MKQIALKYLFNIFSGSTPESGQALFWDGNLNWFTPDDLGKIGNEIYVSESKRKVTEEGVLNANLKFANENSIIITKRAPIGNLAILSQPSSCNQGCFILENNKDNVNSKYYYYFLSIQKENLNSLGRGSTFLELNADDMKSFNAPFPSVSQQNKIVAYLDKEVAKIDALIEKKNKLLKLLEEKKKATISQAVTKGLNPKVKMKSSGIEWLGDIPEHWEIVKLKYLTEGLKYGANEAAEEDNPDFPRYIRITDIDENGNLKPETFKSIPLEIAEDYLLEDGDILFARSGATVGKTFRYTSDQGISAYAGYLIRMRPYKKIDSKYMYYFTLSNSYWSQIYIDSIQATIQNFSGDKYANMLVTVPSADEQFEIAKYLNSYLKQFTLLRGKINISIDLLKEKRTAIISAAINGELNL